MNDLRAVNVEKCLSVVNEFFDDVQVEDGHPELLSKKQDAELALEQLEMLFKTETYDAEQDDKQCNPCGDAGQK